MGKSKPQHKPKQPFTGVPWSKQEVVHLLRAWRDVVYDPKERTIAEVHERIFEQFRVLCGGETVRSPNVIASKKRSLENTFHWISEMNQSYGREWFTIAEDERKSLRVTYGVPNCMNIDEDIYDAIEMILRPPPGLGAASFSITTATTTSSSSGSSPPSSPIDASSKVQPFPGPGPVSGGGGGGRKDQEEVSRATTTSVVKDLLLKNAEAERQGCDGTTTAASWPRKFSKPVVCGGGRLGEYPLRLVIESDSEDPEWDDTSTSDCTKKSLSPRGHDDDDDEVDVNSPVASRSRSFKKRKMVQDPPSANFAAAIASALDKQAENLNAMFQQLHEERKQQQEQRAKDRKEWELERDERRKDRDEARRTRDELRLAREDMKQEWETRRREEAFERDEQRALLRELIEGKMAPPSQELLDPQGTTTKDSSETNINQVWCISL